MSKEKKSVSRGLRDGWTRSTFIVKEETVEILKRYAYTQRLTLKEVIEEAFDQYIDRFPDDLELLPLPEDKEK